MCKFCYLTYFLSQHIVVAVVILAIIIIIVVRRRRSRNFSTSAADTDNMRLKEVETVDNEHYANATDQPTGTHEKASEHEYDIPKAKKSSTSSLRHKESNSRYELLSNVEKPGDDP